MLPRNIDDITEKDLEDLVENSVLEKKTLEYKAALPGTSITDKKEFLADVSSLANSMGGDIVFGIACDDSTGMPKPSDGISEENWDQVILRLESSIRDGIKPRIAGIAMKAIPLSNSKHVLIARVPKSWNSPHRVTFEGHDKFYGRSTNGKYPLDVDELRDAFNLSATLAEKVRNLRIDRVNRILADDTPVPLMANAKIVLHVVPIVSFNSGQAYDVTLVERNPRKLPAMESYMSSRRYNLDGILAYSIGLQGKFLSYTQLFKNGIIEATDASFLEPRDGRRTIRGSLFEEKLIDLLSACLALMKDLSVELPVFVFVSLLEVKGYAMSIPRAVPSLSPVIDREHLLLPEAVVHSYETKAADVLHPCFDSLWNACGYPRSLNYDKNGVRIG
jgi:hypothetical protein